MTDDNTHDPIADAAKIAAIRTTMKALRKKYIASPRDADLKDAFDLLIYRAIHLSFPDQPIDDEDVDADYDDDDDFDNEDSADDHFVEGRALAVLGHSGAGKSTALARVLANQLADYGQPTCLVIYVCAPAPCTLKTLGRAILRCLGYPVIADRKEHEIWDEVRNRLAKMGTRIVYIDEMQNITSNAKKDEANRIRDTLKSLMNSPEHPICLLLAGLPELKYFLEEDTQVRRRTRFVPLESLSENDLGAVKGTVQVLAKFAGLTANFSGHLGQRLIHASLNEFGTMIEMTHEAIEHALKSGANVVTRENYATSFAQRTGNLAPANPFVADDWRGINCSYVLMEGPNDREEPVQNPKGPNKRGNNTRSPRNGGSRRPKA
jgi:hypothetical protein